MFSPSLRLRRFLLPSLCAAASLLVPGLCGAQGVAVAPAWAARLGEPSEAKLVGVVPAALQIAPDKKDVNPAPLDAVKDAEIVPAPAAEGRKSAEPKSAWLTHPKVQVFPRTGFFGVPPTGPGYYSLRDVLEENCREKPPANGYPRFPLMANSFFDADFRYVDDPKYQCKAEWW